MFFRTEPPKGDRLQLSVRRDLLRGRHVPTGLQFTTGNSRERLKGSRQKALPSPGKHLISHTCRVLGSDCIQTKISCVARPPPRKAATGLTGPSRHGAGRDRPCKSPSSASARSTRSGCEPGSILRRQSSAQSHSELPESRSPWNCANPRQRIEVIARVSVCTCGPRSLEKLRALRPRP